MRRQQFYSVEYHGANGRRDAGEEDDHLSRSRAHELAETYILRHPNRAAIIYLEIHKWYGMEMGRKGIQRSGAKKVETVAKYIGPSWTRPIPRSVMETEGKFQDIDIPIIRPGRLERAGI